MSQHVQPVKTQTSLLNFKRKVVSLTTGFSNNIYHTSLVANNKDTDQAARMRMLICAFVVRTLHKQVCHDAAQILGSRVQFVQLSCISRDIIIIATKTAMSLNTLKCYDSLMPSSVKCIRLTGNRYCQEEILPNVAMITDQNKVFCPWPFCKKIIFADSLNDAVY